MKGTGVLISVEIGGWETVDSTDCLIRAKLFDDFKDGIVYVALDVI
jgi:hypothetical protein